VNRGTDLPAGGTAFAFTPESPDDANKKLWTAFCTKNATYIAKAEFKGVIETLKPFVVPVAAEVDEKTSFSKRWKPGGPWNSP
jgi:hypothetical protein